MAKNDVSYETHPELYHFRPGTTEPELKDNPSINSTLGADVVSKEKVKSGPVGAKGKPKATNKSAAKKAPAAKK